MTTKLSKAASPQDPQGEAPSDQDANLSDWNWAFEARSSGALDAYSGQHVVVFRRRVIAADPHADEAIRQAERLTGASADAFAVLYVDDPEREGLLYVR